MLTVAVESRGRKEHAIYRFFSFLALFTSFAAALGAQDLRTVTSPNGQIKFRLFVAPRSGEEARLAYQVWYEGKRLIDTSFLGFEIRDQIMLGEKVGLIASKTEVSEQYRSLTAEYMQNGSLGRLINIEVRVFDDGLAFRYLVPRSTPLDPMLVENESTEFRLAEDAEIDHKLLSHVPGDIELPLPLTAHLPGLCWISIMEVPEKNYPRMFLTHSEGTTLLSALPASPNDPKLAFAANPPLTSPWRIVSIGASVESLSRSGIAGRIGH